MIYRFRRGWRRRRSDRSRAQSLTEFALVLPVFLLVVLIGLDFGRLFEGWVHLQQAARIAANYASTHEDWTSGDQATMTTLVTNDASTSDCAAGTLVVSSPDWSQTLGTLKAVKVTVQCDFGLVSPLGALIQLATRGVGNQASTIPLSADTVFPIRNTDFPGAQGGTPEPAPVASLSGSFGCIPTSGTTPLTIVCRGGWSNAAASWSWTWGDGNSTNGCTNTDPVTDGFCEQTHTYSAVGTYTASFTVTNLSGSSTATKTITVNAVVQDPIASFVCTQHASCTGTSPYSEIFHSTSTGTATLNCTWDFGLGSTLTSNCSNNQPVVYGPGTCTVTLTVTNGLGATDTTSKQVVTSGSSGTCTILGSPTPPPSPTPTPIPTGTPGPTPTPTAIPTPTPIPYCIVPQLIGHTFTKNNWTTTIVPLWTANGFTAANLSPSPAFSNGSPNSTRSVATQSLGSGNSVLCSSTMTFTYTPSP